MRPLKRKFIIIGTLLTILIVGCSKSPHEYPAFSDDGHVNMVIEIPAGTNLKYEYSPEADAFTVEIVDGDERKVAFLPYPGNYGFIPSTLVDSTKGGDGDPLDILLLSASLPRGMVIKVVPIGVLQFADRGEQDDKIIAVPLNAELRTINCTTFSCLKEEYPSAVSILELWFRSYKGSGKMAFKGWMDEKRAMTMINNVQISDEQK